MYNRSMTKPSSGIFYHYRVISIDSISAKTTQWSLETLAERNKLYRATGGSVVYYMYYSHFGSWYRRHDYSTRFGHHHDLKGFQWSLYTLAKRRDIYREIKLKIEKNSCSIFSTPKQSSRK